MKKYLPLLGAGMLAAGIMLCGLFVGYQINNRPDISAAGTAVPKSIKSIESATQYAVEAVGSIAIPGYDTITLKAGRRTQNITLVNPAENECYFIISILLPDGTTLYKSGYIAPGSEINSIKLSTVPIEGIYENTVLRYSCWSENDEGILVERNGADTICTLEVEP